jgi:prephenate dehydratase
MVNIENETEGQVKSTLEVFANMVIREKQIDDVNVVGTSTLENGRLHSRSQSEYSIEIPITVVE